MQVFMLLTGSRLGRRAMLLVGAFLLDMLLGDPHGLWHPVQGVGAVIAKGEAVFSRLLKFDLKEAPGTSGRDPGREHLAGVLEVILVLMVTMFVGSILLMAAAMIHPYLFSVLELILAWQMVASRSLQKAAMEVYRPLAAGELEKARYAVSMIVGRDTQRLDETGVAKAAIETVAESTSDGVIAPYFYMFLFGPLGGLFYKAVNTMDSMIGYRSDRYQNFGTAAARLDDVVNFIPSRLAALLLIAATAVLSMSDSTHFDPANAFRIWKRDRFNHPSPNSAQTESVVAGALHVQLAGDAWYFGVLHKKKTQGDADRPVEYEDIRRACRLMLIATALLIGLIAAAAVLCAAG